MLSQDHNLKRNESDGLLSCHIKTPRQSNVDPCFQTYAYYTTWCVAPYFRQCNGTATPPPGAPFNTIPSRFKSSFKSFLIYFLKKTKVFKFFELFCYIFSHCYKSSHPHTQKSYHTSISFLNIKNLKTEFHQLDTTFLSSAHLVPSWSIIISGLPEHQHH